MVVAAAILATTFSHAQASVLSVSVGTGWNAISLPYEPVNGDPYDLFDELRPPSHTFDLLSGSLHRYDNDMMGYATYMRQTPAGFGPAVRGEGYWLWVSTGTVITYECLPPSCVPSVTLNGAGWHMIGLPRLGQFSLSDVLVTNDATGESKLFADAVAAQWVQSPIYRIDRTDTEGNGTIYTSLPALGQPLTDVALDAYAAYWVNQFADSLALTFDVPPTDLTAEATSTTEVDLAWSDNSQYDTGYEVERRIPSASFQRIAALPANTSQYTDATATPSTTYEYRVRGLNAMGASAYSNTASATTPDASTPIPLGTVTDVVTDGSYAYLTSDEHGVVVVDVRDPAEPRGVGATDVGFVPTHLDREGSLVVAVGGDDGIAVVDVSNPVAPECVSSLSVPAMEVAVAGRYAYLADATPGQLGYFRVVDLWNPSSPTQVASLELGRLPQEIVTVGDYAYVASSKGMCVIDVRVPSAPVIAASSAILCRRATAKPGFAYVDGAPYSGIQVVDVGDPTQPTVVGQHQMLAMLNRFVVQGDLLYAGCQDLTSPLAYLRIMDVSDPSNPFTTKLCRTPGTANGVAVYGSYAYIADGGAGLQVVDVSDPYHPFVVGNAQ